MMQFTALQIAALTNGTIEGDPQASVDRVAKIEEAAEGSLSFIANPKYEEFIYQTQASILIVNESLVLEKPVRSTLIRVENPYASFASLLEKYNDMMAARRRTGVEQPSQIASTAKLGADVYVGAFSYIGDHSVIGDRVNIYPGCYIGDQVTIGNDVTLHPGVKIYAECVIGNKVIIHAGTVIGSDGFGFAPQPDGTFRKVPQIGNVVLEDGVEIGSNATIDRATMGSTLIRRGTKLDNLIQIAHNVEIGTDTVIAAQSGVSGSTKIGNNCMVGGQVGFVGHINIADRTKFGAQSGVSKSITEPGQSVNGTPAFDYKSSLKSHSIFRNLPELQQRLTRLEEMVQELSSLLADPSQPVKK